MQMNASPISYYEKDIGQMYIFRRNVGLYAKMINKTYIPICKIQT